MPISLVVHYHERPFTLIGLKEYSDDGDDDLLTTAVFSPSGVNVVTSEVQ